MKVSRSVSALVSLGAVWLLTARPASAELPGDVRAWMDESVNPCDDFYKHVCGKFEFLLDGEAMSNVMTMTRGIYKLEATLEKIRADTSNDVGKFYATCMNTALIEELGQKSFRRLVKGLKDIATHRDLVAFAGVQYLSGTTTFVRYNVRPDARDRTRNVLSMSMPTLPIPAQVYTDPAFTVEELSAALDKYVAATLIGTGDWGEQKAMSAANGVTKLISEIASFYNDDSPVRYMTIAEAKAAFPSLVGDIFRDVKSLTANNALVRIVSPKYFAEAEKLILETDLEVLKAYVYFRAIHDKFEVAPEALRKARQSVSDELNNRESTPEDRTAMCTRLVKTYLPKTMAKLVIKAWNAEEGIKMTEGMLDSMLALMEKRVLEVEWLSKETREAAIKKVKATAKAVGAAKDTAELKFNATRSLLSNMAKGYYVSTTKMLRSLEKPVDRSTWQLNAAEVNGEHVQELNQVCISIGLIQPPMFNVSYHLVRNFGAIGATIGHEIVHGYGTVGRKFDENGNSRDWWTHDDAAEFESRSQCFIDQYSSFELMDDEGKYVVNNNGERTLEENIADNGGLRLARQAYKKFAKENPELLKGFDLTEDEVEKLFFISMGQMYCSRLDAENIKMIMIDNGHSIGPDRVNGMMMNSKVFSKVFQCPKGSAMNPATKCELW